MSLEMPHRDAIFIEKGNAGKYLKGFIVAAKNGSVADSSGGKTCTDTEFEVSWIANRARCFGMFQL